MKYLAIDLGSKTLGLAYGTGIIASPWKTLRFKENDFNQALKELLIVIKEYQPDEIVLGYPLNMDGSVGESAETVLEFKKMLEEKIDDINVVLLDERRSTFSANQVLIAADLSRKARKEKKDQVAATIILQTYFDKLNFEKQRKEKKNDE